MNQPQALLLPCSSCEILWPHTSSTLHPKRPDETYQLQAPAGICLPAYAAETRGVKRVEIKTQAGDLVGLYEQSHALVIGVSDYTGGCPDLECFYIKLPVLF